jgi:exonuclease VII small subunit
MGKIILEFDSIEESIEARNALDGSKWKIAMWDLDQVLRSVERNDVSLFGNYEASNEEYKVCVKIREEMRKILNQANLDLED